MARARELCRQAGDTPQLIEALCGVGVFYQHRGDFQTARELFAQCLALAERLPAPAFLVRAPRADGGMFVFPGRGSPRPTRTSPRGLPFVRHSKTTRWRFFHSQGDLEQCLGYTSGTLWMLGYPDQALSAVQRDARPGPGVVAHLHSGARPVYAGSRSIKLDGRRLLCRTELEAALALMTAQGVRHLAVVRTCLRGWALTVQGEAEAGMALMHQGLAAERATGSVLGRSLFLAQLAEVYGASGQAEEGLRILAEALAARGPHGGALL